jgi:hypothetical protein
LLCSRPTQADDFEFNTGFKVAVAFAFIGELSLDITSLAFALGNVGYSAADIRPSSTYIIGGYVCGGLNMAEGIVVLALFSRGGRNDFAVGFGIAHLVLGALNIGTSYWGSTKPDYSKPQVSLSPMILVDRDGSPAVGVGLQVMNW